MKSISLSDEINKAYNKSNDLMCLTVSTESSEL